MANIIEIETPILRGSELTAEEKLREAANWVRAVWREAVSGRMLPGMTRPVNDPNYVKALSDAGAVTIRNEGHDIVAEINLNYPRWEEVEMGRPEKDFRQMLLQSAKARPLKPKNGKPQPGVMIIVPFQHREAETPRGTYDQVRMNGYVGDIGEQSNYNMRADGLVDPSATGDTIRSAGNKFAATPQAPTPSSPGLQTVRSLTFRTVSTFRFVNGRYEGTKPGTWVQKAVPPNPVLKSVVEFVTPQVEQYLHDL